LKPSRFRIGEKEPEFLTDWEPVLCRVQKKIALKNQRVYDDSKQSSGNEQEGISYEPRTGFTPIGLAGTSPLILVVKSTLPVKTVPDLVAYAKEHPGKLSYGSAGVGTGQHIVGEWMKK
jgi:hypothetical protein